MGRIKIEIHLASVYVAAYNRSAKLHTDMTMHRINSFSYI